MLMRDQGRSGQDLETKWLHLQPRVISNIKKFPVCDIAGGEAASAAAAEAKLDNCCHVPMML